MIVTSFIFGTLAAFFAVIFEIITIDLTNIHDYSSLTTAFFSVALLLAVALIEEGSKYLFLRQYLLRYFASANLSTIQSLSLGLSFGIGFSAIETAFILSESTGPDNFLWLLGIFFVHITTSFIFISFLKNTEKRAFSVIFLPLFLAILIHFLYDVTISMAF